MNKATRDQAQTLYNLKPQVDLLR